MKSVEIFFFADDVKSDHGENHFPNFPSTIDNEEFFSKNRIDQKKKQIKKEIKT